MIKLIDLLTEIESSTDAVSITDLIDKFIKKNHDKLYKLICDENWDGFYDLGFREFPEMEQYKIAQEMNKSITHQGWLDSKDKIKVPTDKQLKDAVFGKPKDLGKGITMGKYTAKQKLPKNTENKKPVKDK
jgi:hypothetical protein